MMLAQMVDSAVETTRVYWRMTYLGFDEAMARDPRPAREVISEWLANHAGKAVSG